MQIDIKKIKPFIVLIILVGSFQNLVFSDSECPPISTPTAQFDYSPVIDPNNDGIVLHKSSGLTWSRCVVGQTWDGVSCNDNSSRHTWSEALAIANNSQLAGYDDWRLASFEELLTIIEDNCSEPAINLTVFPNTYGSFYWSSTIDINNSREIWVVNFKNSVQVHDSTFPNHFRTLLRLVRGGQAPITDALILTEELRYLVDNLDLKRRVNKRLQAPLKKALNLLNDKNPNNDRIACRKLSTFITRVTRKLSKELLAYEDAQQLINNAENIQNLLMCQ